MSKGSDSISSSGRQVPPLSSIIGDNHRFDEGRSEAMSREERRRHLMSILAEALEIANEFPPSDPDASPSSIESSSGDDNEEESKEENTREEEDPRGGRE
jgi:hypothetical protein